MLGEMVGQRSPEMIKKLSTVKTEPKLDCPDLPHRPEAAASTPVPLDEPIKSLVTWECGSPVPYRFIASMMTKIEAESGRNSIIEIVGNHVCAIACTTPSDLVLFGFLCTGELRPLHEGVKLDVSEAILIDGLSHVTGMDASKIKQDVDKGADLCELALVSRMRQSSLEAMCGQKSATLTIREVYQALLKIANIQGKNAHRTKIGKIVKLMSTAKGDEAKFLLRSLSGSLRIGCALSSILIGIGRGFRLRDYYIKATSEMPDDTELMRYGEKFKKIYQKSPLLDKLILNMLKAGESFESLEEACDLKFGIPVMPMLAKPAKSIAEIRQRLGNGEITCEYKYDGERAQIHKEEDGSVTIYSQNVKNATAQFADILPLIRKHVSATSFIIDSEIVAYDMKQHIILPFQTLMHRSRKGTEGVSPIQVCVFAFDLLFVDGKSLIKLPLFRRRAELHRIVTPVEHKFQTAVFLDTDLDHLEEFFREAIANHAEGLIIKSMASEYDPGKRSQHWAKLKKGYVRDLGTVEEFALADCVDVVVVGATMGNGKRHSVYGAYLVAVWNKRCQLFQTICEVGIGFSDQILTQFTELFKDKVVKKPPPRVQYGKNSPQFYIPPTVVWEINASDITISPTTACCLGDVEENAGFSLRSGKFLRVREDKDPMNCTSADRICEMYYAQPNIKN
jgi:DNA ligase-1